MSDPEGDVAGAWRMLGKRWTLPILKIMGSKEAMRFCEIKKALPGISATMLSARLLELEREWLVEKRIHYSTKVEYSLTASARELWAILEELDAWWSMRRPALQHVIANYQ
jgi:DNA-binding HxlR family transcriptional regulator